MARNKKKTPRAAPAAAAQPNVPNVPAEETPRPRMANRVGFRSFESNCNLIMYISLTVLYFYSCCFDVIADYDLGSLKLLSLVFICYWNVAVVVGLLRIFALCIYHSKYWHLCFCLYVLVHSGYVSMCSLSYADYFLVALADRILFAFGFLTLMMGVLYWTSHSYNCLRCEYCYHYRSVFYNTRCHTAKQQLPPIPPEIDPAKSNTIYAKCLVFGFCLQNRCPPFLNLELGILTVQHFISIAMTLLAYTVVYARTDVDLEKLMLIIKYLRIRSIPDQLFLFPAATVFKNMIPIENVTNVFHNYTTSWSIEGVFNHFCILPDVCVNK